MGSTSSSTFVMPLRSVKDIIESGEDRHHGGWESLCLGSILQFCGHGAWGTVSIFSNSMPNPTPNSNPYITCKLNLKLPNPNPRSFIRVCDPSPNPSPNPSLILVPTLD